MAVRPVRELEKREQGEVEAPQRERRLAPFEEMERWFEEAFNRPFFGYPRFPSIRFPELRMPWAEELSPDVDVYEEDKDVVVKAELPGLRKEDLDINITDDIVTISGEKKAEEKVERKNFYRVERSFGSFTRRLRLPSDTIAGKAKATFKDGVLEIRIPKTEEAKEKTKKIQVE